MKNGRPILNIAIAGLLALGIIGIGITSYFQIQADTVLPGFATAKVRLRVLSPNETKISIDADFATLNQTKHYFKSRQFELKEGENDLTWYIRQIPGGKYTYNVTSDQGIFIPSGNTVEMTNNVENKLPVLSLDLDAEY